MRRTGLICFLAASLAGASPAATLLSEGFDDVSALVGWTMVNNSAPAGVTGWFQGNTGIFNAQSGDPDSYIAANFLNAALGGNISNWLITPLLSISNGDTVSFYLNAAGFLPDRIELRLSTNGASADVGSTATSVGDFATQLLAIDPVPSSWTLYTATVSGLAGTTAGRYAFRYVVTDTLNAGDYVGIDTVSIESDIPEPATLSLIGFGIAAFWLGRTRRRQA